MQNINQVSEELEQLVIKFLKEKNLKLSAHLSIHGVPLNMMEDNTDCKFTTSDGGKLKYFTFSKSSNLSGVTFFSEFIN